MDKREQVAELRFQYFDKFGTASSFIGFDETFEEEIEKLEFCIANDITAEHYYSEVLGIEIVTDEDILY